MIFAKKIFYIGIVFIFLFLLYIILEQSNFFTVLIGVITIYTAFYAIAWAKYEFYITRQSQQVSVFAALCATNDAIRISCAPSLSLMTQKKLPKYPTFFSPLTFIPVLYKIKINEKELPEYNLDSIETISKLINGFKNWRKADFGYIVLNKMFLNKVNFCEAIFWQAKLNKIYIVESDLKKVNFIESNLKGIMITRSNLKGANFENANLEEASFCKANFEDVSLKSANLKEVVIENVNFSKANLFGANFKGAFFWKAKLIEVFIEKVNFERTHFKETILCPIFILNINKEKQEINNETQDFELIQKCVDLLSSAKALENVILPSPVDKIMKEKFPNLFGSLNYRDSDMGTS